MYFYYKIYTLNICCCSSSLIKVTLPLTPKYHLLGEILPFSLLSSLKAILLGGVKWEGGACFSDFTCLGV